MTTEPDDSAVLDLQMVAYATDTSPSTVYRHLDIDLQRSSPGVAAATWGQVRAWHSGRSPSKPLRVPPQLLVERPQELQPSHLGDASDLRERVRTLTAQVATREQELTEAHAHIRRLETQVARWRQTAASQRQSLKDALDRAEHDRASGAKVDGILRRFLAESDAIADAESASRG